jgi:hypothetical protein
VTATADDEAAAGSARSAGAAIPARSGGSGATGRLVVPETPLALHFKAVWNRLTVGHYTFDIRPADIRPADIGSAPAGKVVTVRHEFVVRVKIGFVTAFRYEHRVDERWEAGLLRHLRAETRDEGATIIIEARGEGGEIVCEGPDGCRRAPGGLLTTTCAWHPAFVVQTSILDASDGAVVALATDDRGAAVRRVGGRDLAVHDYGFASAHLAGALTYEDNGYLVAASIERKGHRVAFVREG